MSTLRVLVVDDQEDNAELLAELIAAQGHSVRVATSGNQALDLFEASAADVLFLDVSLPDMDGYQVAGTIRQRFGPACRIVAVTGLSGLEERAAARAAGCNAFLGKPFDRQQVLQLLGPVS